MKSCKDFFLMKKMLRRNKLRCFAIKELIVLVCGVSIQCVIDCSNYG